jgi:hypothetical protein
LDVIFRHGVPSSIFKDVPPGLGNSLILPTPQKLKCKILDEHLAADGVPLKTGAQTASA